MADASLFLRATDTPHARVSLTPDAPQCDYIVVHFSAEVSLFLPNGASGSAMARTLAAVLLNAADEYDATRPAPDAQAEADCYRVAHTPSVQP